jgi:hypothetical protein
MPLPLSVTVSTPAPVVTLTFSELGIALEGMYSNWKVQLPPALRDVPQELPVR